MRAGKLAGVQLLHGGDGPVPLVCIIVHEIKVSRVSASVHACFHSLSLTLE